jgi:elongation factor P
VRLPIKMRFKVTEAPPNLRGNTAQGGDKLVTLETGATITTPMFVNEGDTIEVNTETNEYVGRVS